MVKLKRQGYALYLASQDPRVPIAAKWLALIVVAYALSPIDLIPDFIPVIGYLDDLILLPLGIAATIKLIPRAVWQDCLRRADDHLLSELPASRAAVMVIAAIWLCVSAVAVVWAWRLFAS